MSSFYSMAVLFNIHTSPFCGSSAIYKHDVSSLLLSPLPKEKTEKCQPCLCNVELNFNLLLFVHNSVQ